MTDAPYPPPATGRSPLWGPLIVAAIIVGLALLGVALATAKARVAPGYWVALVPVYGLLCTWVAWRHAPPGGEQLVLRQILHWLGIAGAVAVDFYVPGVGLEAGAATGADALLLLALGSYLAGVHLAWPFLGVGLLLTLTLVLVMRADQYLWLLLLAGVVAVAGVFAWRRLRPPARP